MNKLNKLLASVIAMTLLSAAPLIAGSGDFAGPFIQVSATSIGAELDGQYTDNEGNITKGTGGSIAQVGAIDVGYSIPLSDTFLIGIGVSTIPGEAEISKADDAANAADITIKAKDFVTYYKSSANIEISHPHLSCRGHLRSNGKQIDFFQKEI